jgi:hypothetical protein
MIILQNLPEILSILPLLAIPAIGAAAGTAGGAAGAGSIIGGLGAAASSLPLIGGLFKKKSSGGQDQTASFTAMINQNNASLVSAIKNKYASKQMTNYVILGVVGVIILVVVFIKTKK